ncbi:MAG: protein kinase [Streptomycetaceae bacterium]|nr:protein kinase [Streptomycetaceae bacterium]
MDTTQPPPGAPPLPDRYTVVDRLAPGGTATLWRAYDGDLGREVVVKVPTSQEPTDRAALAHEARMTRKARGDGVPVVHDMDVQGPVPYFTMERVAGENLRATRSDHAVELPDRAAVLGIGIAKALQNVHFTDVVHRDIKPENLIMRPDGRIGIVDFANAVVLGTSPDRDRFAGWTPGYTAPERFTQGSGTGTPQSDLYAVGVIMRDMLTGGRTFPPTESPRATAMRQVEGDVRPTAEVRPDLPRPLTALVDQLMRVDPRQRPLHAGEVVSRLEGMLPDLRRAAEREVQSARGRNLAARGLRRLGSLHDVARSREASRDPASGPRPSERGHRRDEPRERGTARELHGFGPE